MCNTETTSHLGVISLNDLKNMISSSLHQFLLCLQCYVTVTFVEAFRIIFCFFLVFMSLIILSSKLIFSNGSFYFKKARFKIWCQILVSQYINDAFHLRSDIFFDFEPWHLQTCKNFYIDSSLWYTKTAYSVFEIFIPSFFYGSSSVQRKN
jgi:hypothetical protein